MIKVTEIGVVAPEMASPKKWKQHDFKQYQRICPGDEETLLESQ